jgi:hypothetical protein
MPNYLLKDSAANVYLASGIRKLSKNVRVPKKIAPITNDDFREFLHQVGTLDSLKPTGNGAQFEYLLPNLSMKPGGLPFRKFRIHLSHNGKDPLPRKTLKIFFKTALQAAGWDSELVQLED